MAIMTQSQIWNPVTGVFGTGQMQIFGSGGSGAWTVPVGIDRVRVRLWGGGGGAVGSGGGFALKVIYGLAGVVSIPVTVGALGQASGYGGTSSFGTYVSATGGGSTSLGVGVGIGGDINYSGGFSNNAIGGGAANLFGNGGGVFSTGNVPVGGASGYGSVAELSPGGNGLFGSGGGGTVGSTGIAAPMPPTSGFQGGFSIDLIGTGGGGSYRGPGINGGGGGTASSNGTGGYPGGGGGHASSFGAPGMVIVEW
jgi:hypothetical protein